SHDRFLVLDKQEIYHIGASLKDLGRRWFAFSKMHLDAREMLGRLSKT
ncbi:MAG: ORF6N domain-containing protein, partial [Sulfuricurvum sp.]